VDFQEIHVPRGTRLSDYYGTRRPETVFAHSSPVLIRDGAAIRNWEDAEYFVRYMDNSIHWLETGAKFARPTDKQASIRAFTKDERSTRTRAGKAAAQASERQKGGKRAIGYISVTGNTRTVIELLDAR